MIINKGEFLVGEDWLDCTEFNIDSIFDLVIADKTTSLLTSNFEKLLTTAINYSEESYDIIMLSSNSKIVTPAEADSVFNRINYIYRNDISLQILDYSRKNRPSSLVGLKTWWGNEYLYSLFSTFDNFRVSYFALGEYHDNDISNYFKLNLDINGLYNSINTVTSLDVGNGIILEQYNFGNSIIGKYIGNGTFNFKYFAADEKDTLFFSKPIIRNLIHNSSIKQIFYANKILDIEKNTSANTAKIKSLVEMSMASNVLSIHTAFLALEPWRLKHLLEKEVGETKVEFEYEADIINIFPNPAIDYTNIIINEMIESIEIYDLMGKLIFATNGNVTEFRWNLLDFANQKVPAGRYFVVVRIKDKYYINSLIVQ